MKKNYLLTLAAALALVGCSENELLEQQILDENAIAFDTYVGDNAQTRATVIDNKALGVKGFGVNAYYTAQEDFAEGAELNFMQNTKVTFNPDKGDGLWEYSPVKYWPNNAGDKVSFFAYGPYAKGGDANGMVVNGTSIGFTVASEVKDQVDLIYNTNYEGTIDQEKQAVNERIHFQFAHALARIAFTVEAAVDETTNGTNLLDGNTRINVKKVALVGDAGYNADSDPQDGPFYTTGTLNLLPNADERWSSTNGEQGFVFDGGTVDGDGSDNEFYHTVKDVCAENDTEVNVVQLTRFNASEPQRLLNDESYLMVIPQESTQFKIYIEYDVISGGNDNDGTGTYDESAIVNKITSTQPLTVTFEQGKAYNFNLILGMTSVKFEASVADWEDATNDEDEEWLPENEGEANTLLLNTYAEDLKIGETVTIEQQSAASTRSEAAVLSFAGYDENILTYNEDTKVFTAVAAGQTSITVSCEGYDDQEVVINVLPSVEKTTLTNKIKTVSITGGTFTMGNDYEEEDPADPNAWYTDAPSHSVTVAAFQMGQYEVSVAQFVEFLQVNSSNFEIVESYDSGGDAYSNSTVVYSYTASEETVYIPICELAANNITGNDLASLTVADDKKNLPVVCSWEGAALFAESVGGYLPHEEEWEYAARGGTSGTPSWWYAVLSFDEIGILYTNEEESITIENLKNSLAEYENLTQQSTSVETGTGWNVEVLPLRNIEETTNANDWGVYDVLGNVQEWCGNYLYNYLGGKPDEINHMVRGQVPDLNIFDDYLQLADFSGVAFRNCNTGMNETGFRVAFASDYSGGNSSVQTVEE